METIGSRIKKLRKEKKLTQGKLGDLVGVSDVTIGFWEKDVNEPKYENLETLSKMLDTSIEYLKYRYLYQAVRVTLPGQTSLNPLPPAVVC